MNKFMSLLCKMSEGSMERNGYVRNLVRQYDKYPTNRNNSQR